MKRLFVSFISCILIFSSLTLSMPLYSQAAGLADTWDDVKSWIASSFTSKDEINRNNLNSSMRNSIKFCTDENVSNNYNMAYRPDYSSFNYSSADTTSSYAVFNLDDHTVYSPVTNTYHSYSTSNSYSYVYDNHNLYETHYNYDNKEYTQYVYGGDTYVSYIIECPSDPNENRYYEVYFVLPDGRNSYNLTKNEIKGKYTIYNVVPYERNFVDDGQTRSLFHLDGNWQNSAYGAGSASSPLVNFVNGYFDGGLSFNVSSRNTFLCNNFSSFAQVGDIITFFYNVGGSWGYAYNILGTSSSNSYTFYIDSNSLYFYSYGTGYNIILDEIRILKAGTTVDYTIPPSQPYDSNVGWSVPDSYDTNSIAVQILSNITGYQVGGVRPTYPQNGYVFIAVDENHIITSVQVYNGSQWDSCPASIYNGSSFVDCIGYNLADARFDINSSGSGSGGPGSSGGSIGDDDIDENVNSLVDTINTSFTFLGVVPELFATLYSWFPSWVIGLMSTLIGALLIIGVFKLISK